MTRDDVHAALRANATKREAIRPAILTAIREGWEDEGSKAEMRRILADDERLAAVHLRFCREVCGVA